MMFCIFRPCCARGMTMDDLSLDEIELEIVDLELADLKVERAQLEKGFLAMLRNRYEITEIAQNQNELKDLRNKIESRLRTEEL